MNISFALSPLDEARFGIRAARARLKSLEELDEVEERCKNDQVVFLVARVPTGSLDLVQEMERRGYFLTDTLLYFERDIADRPIPKLAGSSEITSAKETQADEVRNVAAQAFAGYFGHYHADQHFARSECDEIYADWAHRGCIDKRVADQVLVAGIDGAVMGFCLIQLQNRDVAVGTLYGVHPDARGRGVYRELVVSAMRWAHDNRCSRILESTQVTNLASQKVWGRLGFEPVSSEYTFHRWVEKGNGE